MCSTVLNHAPLPTLCLTQPAQLLLSHASQLLPAVLPGVTLQLCQSSKKPELLVPLQGGIYNLPTHLSHGARDLIPRMLVVDPLKRITIPEIRCQLWLCIPGDR